MGSLQPPTEYVGHDYVDLLPRARFDSPNTIRFDNEILGVRTTTKEIPVETFIAGIDDWQQSIKFGFAPDKAFSFLANQDCKSIAFGFLRHLWAQHLRGLPNLSKYDFLASGKDNQEFVQDRWSKDAISEIVATLKLLHDPGTRIIEREIEIPQKGTKVRRIIIGPLPPNERPETQTEIDRAAVETSLLRERIYKTIGAKKQPDQVDTYFYLNFNFVPSEKSGKIRSAIGERLQCGGWHAGEIYDQDVSIIIGSRLDKTDPSKTRTDPGRAAVTTRHEAGHAILPLDEAGVGCSEGWASAIGFALNPNALKRKYLTYPPQKSFSVDEFEKLFQSGVTRTPSNTAEIYYATGCFFAYFAQRYGFESLTQLVHMLYRGSKNFDENENPDVIGCLPFALQELHFDDPNWQSERFIEEFLTFFNKR